METKESKNADSFILAQFQALMSHIDNLISSSTMRMYSVLLIWAFSISAISIILMSNLTSPENKKLLYIFIGLFLFFIGIYLYLRQITSSIKVVYYYRILNRVRNSYAENSSEIKKVLEGLPFSDSEPKNILDVFDPGIFLIPVLNAVALTFSFFACFKKIFWTLILFVFILVLQFLIWKIKENKKLGKN